MNRSSDRKAERSTFAARVIATYGRQSLIQDRAGGIWNAVRRGKRGDVVIGDCVLASASSVAQATIESIEPRQTLLYRSDAHRSKELAANVDQVLVIFAARPAFNRWFIWNALLAAKVAAIDAGVVLNKTDLVNDLGPAQQLLAQLQRLGWPTYPISAATAPQRVREQLEPVVQGRRTLLVGQSGMGKSTLLNLLVPQAGMRTQEFSQRLNQGKQTTTAARWFDLPGGGAIVDTPGFQQFGIGHLSPDDIAAGFPEFQQHIGHCRFANCRHLSEPECAIRAALTAGSIDADRYQFYRSLLQR